jgi:hypothetical protein
MDEAFFRLPADKERAWIPKGFPVPFPIASSKIDVHAPPQNYLAEIKIGHDGPKITPKFFAAVPSPPIEYELLVEELKQKADPVILWNKLFASDLVSCRGIIAAFVQHYKEKEFGKPAILQREFTISEWMINNFDALSNECQSLLLFELNRSIANEEYRRGKPKNPDTDLHDPVTGENLKYAKEFQTFLNAKLNPVNVPKAVP